MVVSSQLASCGGPAGGAADARSKAAASSETLDKLAREIDPGAQPPIWPQVPEDVRARVEIDAPRETAPAARLAAARERIGQWSLQISATDQNALGTILQRAYEGVYLAEPLALRTDNDPIALEARALLWTFYSSFISSEPLLTSFASVWSMAGNKLASPMATAKVLATAGPKMNDRLAAEILRAREPATTVVDILWEHASRRLTRGDADGGRALYAEYIRRKATSATLDDQLRVAHAYIRIEDPRAASEVIARVKASATDRMSVARIRNAERDRDFLVKLLALPLNDASPETALSRYDLLFELDRFKEAEVVLAALRKERPKDARVRARSVQNRVRGGEISDKLVDELRDPDLTNRDGSYWSMKIGAAGIAAAKTPTPAVLEEIAASGRELGKIQPGRAAALAFIVDRVAGFLKQRPNANAILALLHESFDAAQQLRVKFPEERDADRIAIALSLFAADPVKGLEAALLHPRVTPEAEPEIYTQRARTAVTLAAYVGKRADLTAVRGAVEEIPPSTNTSTESAREALFGDVDLLAGVMQGERAAWARAATHYEEAKKTATVDRSRLDNNLAYIASASGDATRAGVLFEAAGRAQSGRRWVPLLNSATAPGTTKEEQLGSLRTIAGPADAETPALVSAWLASLEPAPKQAAAAAAKALAELEGGLSAQKTELNARGLEMEGSVTLSLGLRSQELAHTLATNAYALLWLVRPMPLTRADLEAKVKAAAPKPEGPPKPESPPKPALTPKPRVRP